MMCGCITPTWTLLSECAKLIYNKMRSCSRHFFITRQCEERRFRSANRPRQINDSLKLTSPHSDSLFYTRIPTHRPQHSQTLKGGAFIETDKRVSTKACADTFDTANSRFLQ